jgi:hypothetical protein
MKRIYEMAHQVLVWLGPDVDNNGAPATELTRLVSHELCRASHLTISELGKLGTETLDDVLLEADSSRLPLGNSDVWKPLAWLFSREWINRIWVVEEALFAREISVLCGDEEFSWDALGSRACGIQTQVMKSDFADFTMFAHTSAYEASELYDRDSSQ